MLATQLGAFDKWLKTTELSDDRLWKRDLETVSDMEIQMFYARHSQRGIKTLAHEAIDRLQAALILEAVKGQVPDAALRLITHEVPRVRRLALMSYGRRDTTSRRPITDFYDSTIEKIGCTVMKKDIVIIRESIVKVASMLTKQSIKVTQRGSKAYVEWNPRTGAVILVNIPYIPDDATPEFIVAIQGFLDHEVGHVLFTDVKAVAAAKKAGGRVKSLANIFEDVYIERKMAQAFAGSTGTLNGVRAFYLNSIAAPKIKQAMAAGNIEEATGYAAVVQFRAWGGQVMVKDFLVANPAIADLCKSMAEKIGPELIGQISKLTSSWDCVELAKKVKAKLEEKPKTSPPPPPPSKSSDSAPPPPPEDKSEPAEPPEDDDAGEGEPSESTESEDVTSSEVTSSDVTSPEAGEMVDSDPESEHESPPEASDDLDEPEPEPEHDEGSISHEVDDSGKKRDEDEELDEVDADKPEAGSDGGDKDTERADSEDESEDSGEPDEGISAVEEGSKDGDSGEESDAEGDSATDGDLDDTGKPAEPGAEDEPEAASDEPGEDLGSVFDKERDFDEDLGAALTDRAETEFSAAQYVIFSTDWDRIEPAPKSRDSATVERMVNETSHMISGIQKSLERAMAAKARKGWNAGQRRGKISPGSLYKVACGDERVFRQRYEVTAKNTVVSLLIDCSGSMKYHDRIGTAGLAAFALSSTLERLRIEHEVIGFTTVRDAEMTAAIGRDRATVEFARSQALYMPVFKGFDERLSTEAKSRIAHLLERPNWLRENVDGECLQIAARRLVSRKAERHVLMVLSDGQPACPGSFRMLDRHLKMVVESLNKEDTLEVIGIGIEDDSVERYYGAKHVVLDNLASLPTTVVSQLQKVLLA